MDINGINPGIFKMKMNNKGTNSPYLKKNITLSNLEKCVQIDFIYKIAKLVCLLSFFILISFMEVVRFNDFLKECNGSYNIHESFISEPICNIENKLSRRYESIGLINCQKSHDHILKTPIVCAIEKFLKYNALSKILYNFYHKAITVLIYCTTFGWISISIFFFLPLISVVGWIIVRKAEEKTKRLNNETEIINKVYYVKTDSDNLEKEKCITYKV